MSRFSGGFLRFADALVCSISIVACYRCHAYADRIFGIYVEIVGNLVQNVIQTHHFILDKWCSHRASVLLP